MCLQTNPVLRPEQAGRMELCNSTLQKFLMVGNNCRKKLASCSSVSQQMSGEGSRAVTWDRAVLEAVCFAAPLTSHECWCCRAAVPVHSAPLMLSRQRLVLRCEAWLCCSGQREAEHPARWGAGGDAVTLQALISSFMITMVGLQSFFHPSKERWGGESCC